MDLSEDYAQGYATNMQWIETKPCPQTINTLRSTLGISEVLAGLLNNRGWGDPEKAKPFLYPRLAHLENPFELTHLEQAVERLLVAMQKQESILVLGDYDVDGVTSTALLISILRRFNVEPDFALPKRLDEGYGLTQAVIDRLLKNKKPDLFIALDCGTNSVEEVAYLREQGIDVIIVDHHRSKEATPADCILINPHVLDKEDAPWKNLCTVGLVFKFVHGLIKKLRDANDPTALNLKLRNYLDFVSMGTIADLVPLTEENRILTRYGLKSLQNSSRQGINALLEISGMKLGETVQPVDIGYRIGPRINASGRLADATLPVEMLLSDDYSFCAKAAKQLDAFNKERQTIEKEMCKEAEAIVEATQKEAAAIVVWGENWHSGVVGIVAGKLSRLYNRPAVVLASEGDTVKGSGRSVPGIALTKVLTRCESFLDVWGGHPMAVGITLSKNAIDGFRETFTAEIKRIIEEGDFEEPTMEIAWWLEPHQVGEALLNEMDSLSPFGEGNPIPIFGVRNVVLAQRPERFGENNFRFYLTAKPGKKISAIAWNKAERVPPQDEPIELAIKLYWNQWNGQCYPQIELVDWRLAQ